MGAKSLSICIKETISTQNTTVTPHADHMSVRFDLRVQRKQCRRGNPGSKILSGQLKKLRRFEGSLLYGLGYGQEQREEKAKRVGVLK